MRFSKYTAVLLLPTTILTLPTESDIDFYQNLAQALTNSPPYTRNTIETDFFSSLAKRLVHSTYEDDETSKHVHVRDGSDIHRREEGGEGSDFFTKLAAALAKDNTIHTRDDGDDAYEYERGMSINITKTESVNHDTGVGELAWGASGLALGYSAGAGVNFDAVNGTIGGGFNAGVPGQSEGALGGGWTIVGGNLTFGFGGVVANTSVSVAIMGNLVTGDIHVLVNGKEAVV